MLTARVPIWSVEDLVAHGVRVEQFDGPRIRLHPIAWVLRLSFGMAIFVVGIWAVLTRAEARGRTFEWWWIIGLVTLGSLALAVAVASIMQVLRLRSKARDGDTVIGWCWAGIGKVPALRGRSPRGVFAGIGSPVTGVLIGRHGLEVLVDQADVGYVSDDAYLRLSIGYRSNLRWLLIRDDTTNIALRIRPL